MNDTTDYIMPDPNPSVDLPRSIVHNRVLNPQMCVQITKIATDAIKQYRRSKTSAT
jgi:hypothetical protein